MNYDRLIEEFKRLRNLYLAEASKSPAPEYWHGKASGLELAIETVVVAKQRAANGNG